MDLLQYVLFFILAGVVIAGGALVVIRTAITQSALFMALSFLGMAGLFLLLGAETIAFFQILIYVGAITVLILYGVMLTQTQQRPYALFFQKQAQWALVPLAFVGFFVTAVALTLRSDVVQAPGGDLQPLGSALFRDYAFPFEVASVLLLAAMIGAIVLVRRGGEDE